MTMYSEFVTYRALWVAAKRLLTDANREAEGRANRLIGATLCTYFALEGFANDLGERIAPGEWANEKEFFGRGAQRGTLGKIRFLAEITRSSLDRGSRPYQTLRELERVRHDLVHPRTVIGMEVDFDSDGIIELPDSNALRTIEKSDWVERALSDVNALGDQLLRDAKLGFPAQLAMRGTYAFDGAIASAIGWGPPLGSAS
jgi:hypothetical protein